MKNPAEIFEEIANIMCFLSNKPEEIIEVIAQVNNNKTNITDFDLSINKWVRNPEKIFDRTNDSKIILEKNLFDKIYNLVNDYLIQCPDVATCTICVYIDGTWSYGGTSHKSK